MHGDDVGDRRGAGGSRPVTQRPGANGPKHDGRGEDVVLPTQRVFLPEDSLDPLGVQDYEKGRTFARGNGSATVWNSLLLPLRYVRTATTTRPSPASLGTKPRRA